MSCAKAIRPDRNGPGLWVGVASRDHVQAAVDGGFCQLAYGDEAPVPRLRAGDSIVFYSPRERKDSGGVISSPTVIGRVLDDEIAI